MVAVQRLVGPTSFPAPVSVENLSVLSYNVLLPNSEDGWWTYKMYLPPLTKENKFMADWSYREDLLRRRIAAVDADVVCLQEVAPASFDTDFGFMANLGYSGKEMFKKGRFRPATFWKTDRCELIAPAVHKDRTLLTAFRRVQRGEETSKQEAGRNWFVLNCHLQAGPQAARRVRQINEGVRAVVTLAKKLKEKNVKNVPLIVCGDFNGGAECGAVRYLEDGFVDETFREDGEPVSSGRKPLPLASSMTDVPASATDGTPPPPTMVVTELISLMTKNGGYEDPDLSDLVMEKLKTIYSQLASHTVADTGERTMNLADVERYLVLINGMVGRGSEFREAARQMGWKEEEEEAPNEDGEKPRITLPADGLLSFSGFANIYKAELRQGKFWGIAHDMAVLGEPLPDAGVFECRYDRMYCSSAVQPTTVMDFACSDSCPNDREPSDHLPVAASFQLS